MKKILLLTLTIISIFLLTGCNNNEEESPGLDSGKTLVLYFSASHNTEGVAKKLSEVLDSDITEIIPRQEYSKSDLNYGDNNSRATKEQKDETARPKIKNDIDVKSYDTIYLGYPIWWGTNPRIILTLIDKYDLTDKNIILFCTSGGTGIEESMKDLKEYNSKLNIITGKRFSSSATKEEIQAWVQSINEKGE